MHAIVGQDGEKVKKIGSAPAVAKQYDLRVLKAQRPAASANQRHHREMTTLCVILDHMALGRYKQAADVVAAKLKSIEAGVQDGQYVQAAYLELIPVNPDGLTTADEQLLIQNETRLNLKSSHTSDADWTGHGKGHNNNPSYAWIPAGNGKGKKGGGKGKEGGAGKKGDKKF